MACLNHMISSFSSSATLYLVLTVELNHGVASLEINVLHFHYFGSHCMSSKKVLSQIHTASCGRESHMGLNLK